MHHAKTTHELTLYPLALGCFSYLDISSMPIKMKWGCHRQHGLTQFPCDPPLMFHVMLTHVHHAADGSLPRHMKPCGPASLLNFSVMIWFRIIFNRSTKSFALFGHTSRLNLLVDVSDRCRACSTRIKGECGIRLKYIEKTNVLGKLIWTFPCACEENGEVFHSHGGPASISGKRYFDPSWCKTDSGG